MTRLKTLARGDARRFFVTVQFARHLGTFEGDFQLQSTSVEHAKEMGTTHTLCGLQAESWFKFWERPFDAATGDRCPACVTQVSALKRGLTSA